MRGQFLQYIFLTFEMDLPLFVLKLSGIFKLNNDVLDVRIKIANKGLLINSPFFLLVHEVGI